MASNSQSKEDHCARSNFVRGLVQGYRGPDAVSAAHLAQTPRRFVQFWDNLGGLPGDVRECMESWKELKEQGYEFLLFDERLARDFIWKKFGSRYKKAYDMCYHPAMQSDYFRLCYILAEGGCYVDADDVYHGAEVGHLFDGGQLKVQPLCYDITTDRMVPPSIFIEPGANGENWIFYFNNNPLIAGHDNPILKMALASATLSLERDRDGQLPDIQSTTGPGNLTKSIYDAASENSYIEKALVILTEWEDIATSKWPLSYRLDERNWRLSNRSEYKC